MKNSVLRFGALAAAISGALLTGCVVDDSNGNDEEPIIEPPEAASGDIVTWAGGGQQGNNGDGLSRTKTWLNQPMEIEFAEDGRAYIIDWNNHALRLVKKDNTVTTLIGQTIPGDWPCQTPGTEFCDVPLNQPLAAAELSLNHPMDVALLADGTLYLAAWHNHKIEHYDGTAESVTVVAGQQKPGFSLDGIAATEALLNFPDSMVVDSSGAILLSDERTNRIRRIDPVSGMITTVVGVAEMRQAPQFLGEGTAAIDARVALCPYNEAAGSDNPPPGGGLAFDAEGYLYFADTYNHCIRRVHPGSDDWLIGTGDATQEVVTTIAGACGEMNSGYAGDGGAALEAKLTFPHDLEVGPDGALYIADSGNHVIRRVDLESGIITTVAGTGTEGFSGDFGPATEANLRSPYGIDFDAAGNLYIADTMNNRIRQVLK